MVGTLREAQALRWASGDPGWHVILVSMADVCECSG